MQENNWMEIPYSLFKQRIVLREAKDSRQKMPSEAQELKLLNLLVKQKHVPWQQYLSYAVSRPGLTLVSFL